MNVYECVSGVDNESHHRKTSLVKWQVKSIEHHIISMRGVVARLAAVYIDCIASRKCLHHFCKRSPADYCDDSKVRDKCLVVSKYLKNAPENVR